MKIFFAVALFLLAACASNPEALHNYRSYLSNKGVHQVSPEKFQHCHAYGCEKVDIIVFEEGQWSELDSMFKPASKSAGEEHERLIKAVGWFEREVGELNGTSEDVYGTFKKFGPLQLDCVDESTNTTTYLSLIEQRGHLKFHRIRKPHMRAPFFGGGGWPHLTAVITNKESGVEYAIDSWFGDNGEPPYIVPLEEWTHGWRPEK